MKNTSNQGKHHKLKILDEVRTLFWERGYDKTSMKRIARACGFEPSNIYNYFPSKEALLYAILKEDLDKLISSIKRLAYDDVLPPADQLKHFFTSTLIGVLGHRGSGKLLSEEGLKYLTPAHRRNIILLRGNFEAILRKIIRRGIDNGSFAETDEALVSYFILSAIIHSRMWFKPKGRLTAKKIADLWFDLTLNGLQTKEKI